MNGEVKDIAFSKDGQRMYSHGGRSLLSTRVICLMTSQITGIQKFHTLMPTNINEITASICNFDSKSDLLEPTLTLSEFTVAQFWYPATRNVHLH